MNLKFYMAPGSCSTGIHILLEELDKLFEAYIINIPRGDNQQKDYLAINPKGTIPSLVLENGSVLTEFQSIAYYLAQANPESNLIPKEALAAAKTLEIMAYVVNTLHGQGFARIFAPESFMVEGSSQQAIKDKGLDIVNKGFQIINSELENSGICHEMLTIADAALFYVEFWADKLKIALPENCQGHYANMCKRPVVKRVLMEEGYY